MKSPLTQKMLLDWAGPNVFRDAQTLYDKGMVQEAHFEPPYIQGTVSWANRELKTKLEMLSDGTVENKCPCRDSVERGIICAHVIALGLTLVKRFTDPLRAQKYQEEMRRAKRLAEIDESEYLTRVAPGKKGVAAILRLELCEGWQSGIPKGEIPLACYCEIDGVRTPMNEMSREIPLAFSKKDDSTLFVLEDIAEGPVPARMSVNVVDFLNLLKLLISGELLVEGDDSATINAARLASRLHMDLDRENGELILMVHTEIPHMSAGEFPTYLTTGKEGWAFGAHNFWPLERILPGPLRTIYEEPIAIPRDVIPRFLRAELPMISEYMPMDAAVSEDLFTMEPAIPTFILRVKGSPASLSASLSAEYGGGSHVMVAAKGDVKGQFAIPDPDDFLRYLIRNKPREKVALEVLGKLGFAGTVGDELGGIVGIREVLNFLGSAVPALRRLGWGIEMEGRVAPMMDEIEFATPIVNVIDGGGNDWFEVDFAFEATHGDSLSSKDVQRAIARGDSYIERNGKTVLIDSGAITDMYNVFNDCDSSEGSEAGRFKMDNLYSAFVKSSLDVLDGVDVDASVAWRDRAKAVNRAQELAPVVLPAHLEDTLRPYQRDGVKWLRFLEANRFGGILADEMGLGKTLQTLCWLSMERHQETCRGNPSLVVCPTSLVENWYEEAQKFVPDMKVLVISGAKRKALWSKIPDADLVVTSYALLRRDIDEYLANDFACMVLDEAQHIKNRSTRNAVAAKQVRAAHKIVLTGTPVENGVADLWSIMDFLMAGYLGTHTSFRTNYELPIQNNTGDGDIAQQKLRRKIHPFLMRRLKKDVAKDLPAKIEKVQSCTLTKDQGVVYKELLASSRRKIKNMVAEKGFGRSRMEILKTLLRLRQTCCHLDLLKMKDLKSDRPSGKLEAFFELMDEALDGGHRVLVFSQFVTMLTILRKELESRNLTYCYLDGSTKDRMKEVKRFNTDRSVPVFLISLKAGGTGLNLTGADMVIHFDPWWNPAVEDQATDRAHRIGQKRTVYSLKLITRGTVEEKVLEMQRRKKAVINATLGTDEGVMETMSWEDIQELLKE